MRQESTTEETDKALAAPKVQTWVAGGYYHNWLAKQRATVPLVFPHTPVQKVFDCLTRFPYGASFEQVEAITCLRREVTAAALEFLGDIGLTLGEMSYGRDGREDTLWCLTDSPLTMSIAFRSVGKTRGGRVLRDELAKRFLERTVWTYTRA
jgi:hypothetical protein